MLIYSYGTYPLVQDGCSHALDRWKSDDLLYTEHGPKDHKYMYKIGSDQI